MLLSFNGAPELVSAYNAGLSENGADLIAVNGALGDSAVEAVRTAATLSDMEDRTRRLHDILYNELPLEDAEQVISAWVEASDLPEDLLVYHSLEAPVHMRRGNTITHFDSATAPNQLINGPFAISIGVLGQGLFRGMRLQRRLRDEELVDKEHAEILDQYERLYTDRGRFRSTVDTGQTIQNPGDLVLIPGSPQPSLHGVEVIGNEARASVISSYVMTVDHAASPAEMRARHAAERETEIRLLMGALQRIRLNGKGPRTDLRSILADHA